MAEDAFWTPQLVGAHLTQAFRVVPHHAVYSRGGQFGGLAGDPAAAAAAEAFSWGPRFLRDYPRPKLLLFTWARCRAQSESWSDLCRERGWNRSTAELGRQRAAAVIAGGLNAGAAGAINEGRAEPRACAAP